MFIRKTNIRMEDAYVKSLNTPICAVEDWLDIGDISSRKQNCADVIISLSDNKLVPLVKPKIEYNFYMEDTINVDEDDINEILNDTLYIINKHKLLGQKVLVHCNLGVSRSATVVINYLMDNYNITYDVALDKLREVRFCVQPNKLFEKILRRREKKTV